MGVNNRQRRKAKKQQRQQRQHGPSATRSFASGRSQSGDRHVDGVQSARDGVLLAVEVFRSGSTAAYQMALGELAVVGERVGSEAVHQATVWWTDRGLDRAWSTGWQPGDVMRFVRRELTARHADAIGACVAAGGGRQRDATLDDRWASQVAAIADACPSTPDFGPGSPSLPLAVEALSVLLYLPSIPRLSTAPGRTRRAGGPDQTAMLERVRALLAKAESTTFPEEAESLTAKAQQLMARHAIDAAMLDAGQGVGSGAVVAWRIGIDDPYTDGKSLLLHHIAVANRSKAVWCKPLGSSTVFGSRSDLEMVELLFTSLLVQATEPMLRAGRSVDRYGRSRTTSFRKSFLAAYAIRIGHRLASATASAVVEGTERHGDALLPVLAGRAEEVDGAVRDVFPETCARATTITNHSGWVAGQAAADLARLGVGDELAAG